MVHFPELRQPKTVIRQSDGDDGEGADPGPEPIEIADRLCQESSVVYAWAEHDLRVHIDPVVVQQGDLF